MAILSQIGGGTKKTTTTTKPTNNSANKIVNTAKNTSSAYNAATPTYTAPKTATTPKTTATSKPANTSSAYNAATPTYTPPKTPTPVYTPQTSPYYSPSVNTSKPAATSGSGTGANKPATGTSTVPANNGSSTNNNFAAVMQDLTKPENGATSESNKIINEAVKNYGVNDLINMGANGQNMYPIIEEAVNNYNTANNTGSGSTGSGSSGSGSGSSGGSASEPVTYTYDYDASYLESIRQLLQQQKADQEKAANERYLALLGQYGDSYDSQRNAINLNNAYARRWLNQMYGGENSGAGLSNQAALMSNMNNNLYNAKKTYEQNKANALANKYDEMANASSNYASNYNNYVLQPYNDLTKQAIANDDQSFLKYLQNLGY